MTIPEQPKNMKAPVGSGEKVLMKVHPSRLNHAKQYLLGVLFILLWVFLWFGLLENSPLAATAVEFIEPYKIISFGFLGIGLFIIIRKEVILLTETYKLTNFRVTHAMGFLNVHEASIEYERISHHFVKQSFLQRFFGVGTVEIQAVAGASKPEMVIENVPKVKDIRKILDERIFSSGRSDQKADYP